MSLFKGYGGTMVAISTVIRQSSEDEFQMHQAREEYFSRQVYKLTHNYLLLIIL